MYLNDWKDGGVEQIIAAFEISEKASEGVEILLAYKYVFKSLSVLKL